MNILNILWNFAGSDKQILELCPRTDKAKNAALGFLILILAFITGASLFVALSFIFPASSDASITKKVLFYLFYVFVGCIWFMMVTNLYRLLISATGFGDGTVEITIDEVKNNIFKISASLVLSICVSVPITAALLHKEIINYRSPAFEEKINDEFTRIDKANILELSDLYQTLASVDLKNTTSLDRVSEIKNQIELKRKNIAHQKSQAIAKRQAEMEISLIGETKEAFSMHTILVTSIFLILGVIFVLPVFLRMIWVKGCYEYLCEFQNNLVLAKYGIHPQVKIYKNDIEFIQKRYSIPNQILKNLIRKLEKDKNTHSKGLNKAHKAKTKNLKDEYSLS